MTTIIKIRNEIENLISFLEPMLPFVDSHMVDYFSKSAYENYLPHDLKNDISKYCYRDVIDNVLNNKVTVNSTPHLYNYITKTKSLNLYNLKNVCLSRNDLFLKLKTWGCVDCTSIKLQVFIKQKKSHEVEILSEVVTAISSVVNTTHIIDLGDGKGYLSSMLALHHKIPVLGIDAKATNTDGAVKRAKQLEKIWQGIEENPTKSIRSTNEYAVNNLLYKQVTLFVTEHTDFYSLLSDSFLEEIVNIGIVGLHTCGNLGATSIKAFSKDKNVKTLCNVSCCYHLLGEESYEPAGVAHGFPLSSFLRNKRYSLGHTARMLASQAVDRILHDKEMPKRTLFFRAVLEVLLIKHNYFVKYKKIGKFKKEYSNFNDYALCALRKSGLNFTISEDELNELFNSYKQFEYQLNLFHLLRIMLAPAIESLILLDRLLFLHENEFENSFLVQLFDPIVSPRCYGLIAIK